MLLGQILVRKNIVSFSQVEEIIKQQESTSVKLGELMLQKGLIMETQLEDALKEQYWRKNGFWIIN